MRDGASIAALVLGLLAVVGVGLAYLAWPDAAIDEGPCAAKGAKVVDLVQPVPGAKLRGSWHLIAHPVRGRAKVTACLDGVALEQPSDEELEPVQRSLALRVLPASLVVQVPASGARFVPELVDVGLLSLRGQRGSQRVGEGIAVTFDSGILFDVNMATLRTEAQNNLRDLAISLEEYEGTDVLVVGHTDSSGEAAYNQALSESRARAVLAALVSRGVPAEKLVARGYGTQRPLEGNDTDDGRAVNRRVEFELNVD